MPVGVRILDINLADSATLSTDSAETSAPVTNLQDAQLGVVWRAAANSAYVVADLGSAVSFNFVGLFGLEGTSALTRRVGLSSADSTGAARDLYDSGTASSDIDVATFGQMLHWGDWQGRYLRIDLSDTQPPEAGRIVVGMAWAPARSWDFPAELGVVDRSLRQQTPTGNVFIKQGPKHRVADITLPAISEADAWTRMLAMDLRNGIGTDILLCLDRFDTTYRHQKTMWGLMVDPSPISWRAHGMFGRRLRVEERVRD